ncbi:GntR family transcriptional regulator [Aliicoccus persicus]|nr:GntR family transcriptional regulator [Aliicoccus persicus]SEV95002.1 GntR family transcriptional regulator [Aliicoccus persicus]
MSTVLYRNIADDLRQQIKDGVYNEGDKLPSERHLCEHYEASRITIRQALELLEQEQLVVRRHGKGTFVLPSKYNQLLNDLYSF